MAKGSEMDWGTARERCLPAETDSAWEMAAVAAEGATAKEKVVVGAESQEAAAEAAEVAAVLYAVVGAIEAAAEELAAERRAGYGAERRAGYGPIQIDAAGSRSAAEDETVRRRRSWAEGLTGSEGKRQRSRLAPG